jgi:hypothetical protein
MGAAQQRARKAEALLLSGREAGAVFCDGVVEAPGKALDRRAKLRLGERLPEVAVLGLGREPLAVVLPNRAGFE